MAESREGWPALLSLAVHEFRTPMTVVAGYVRMLLKERAGPLSEPQRKLLTEAERSCQRLSALIAELSDVSHLEDGRTAFSRHDVDLFALVEEAAAQARDAEGRGVRVLDDARRAVVPGDPVRLRQAFVSLCQALLRDTVGRDAVVLHRAVRGSGRETTAWIAMGEEPVAAALRDAGPEQLEPFDEWRGGCGLSLPLARRIIEAHGGAIWSPGGDRRRTGALVRMPLKA